MNTIQRVAKNTGVLLIAQFISFILNFFFVMYTARYLSARGYGVLSFALAFTGIFGVFADFGLGNFTIREVARNKNMASKYLGNIAVMKLILVVITFGLIIIIINILGYPEQTVKVIYFLGLSVVFNAFIVMFYSIFQAYEKMEYVSLGQILRSVLMLGGAILAISLEFSVVGFGFIYCVTNFINLVYSFIISIYSFAKPKIEIDYNFWKSTIKGALPFFLSSVFSIIVLKIDVIMLSMMQGDMAVGWYSAAYKLMEALMFIPSTFVGSLYPVISRFHLSSNESLKKLYQKSFQYLSIIGLPIAVGTTILADKIILIIYKGGYVNSIIALKILIWTTPIIFLTYMFGTMLASINRQNITLKIVFLCMLFKVVINLILIPKYSYVGASVATVCTEMLSFILCYYFLSKFVQKISIYRFIIKPIIASSIMALFILLFITMKFFLLICISIAIYFGTIIVLKAFSEEDLNLFKQIIMIKQRGVEK